MPDNRQQTEDEQTSEEMIVNEAGVVTSRSGLPDAPHISGPTPISNEPSAATSPGNTPEPKSPGLGTAGPPV